MNKSSIKEIVVANVNGRSTTTYKHLGSMHDPLTHGNWSKGAGMYGGAAGGAAGGGLAKKVSDRLRNATFRDEKGEAKQKLQSKKFTRAELEQAKKEQISFIISWMD